MSGANIPTLIHPSVIIGENVEVKDMAFIKRNAVVDALNEGMKKVLNEFSKQVKIEFITKTKYVELEEV